MSRRIATFVVALLAGACGDLEDELQGEPCTVEKDCWHTQECSRTIEEATLGLPGVCQPEGTGCVEGAQLGCTCNPADPSISCLSPAVPIALQNMYPRMVCDPGLLRCAIAPQGGNP